MSRRGNPIGKRQIAAKSDASVSPKGLARKAGAAAAILALAASVWLVERVTRPRNFPDEKVGSPSDRTRERPSLTAGGGDRFAVAPIAETPFRNASSAVDYAGSQACVECHRDQHGTYLETTHSRSLAEVDLSREPPDGEFYHALSGRHYRIYRKSGTLRLREFIQDAAGEEVVLTDLAANYSLGSGNYARMYLVRAGDFLVEAPVTWYPRRNVWGMSAGYEKNPHQPGFSREIDAMCLYCHAGKIDPIGGSNLRLNVSEMAIGCERCHGPGALHVQERKAESQIRGKIDDSIVNPRHLSRERQEDVCAQCHLSGLADVSVRGRSKADFRPGMRLSDFVVSYSTDRPDTAMTVSGQIQQMRLSRCYRESPTMSCATCHDLHSPPDESKKVDYYRGKCLNCHQADSCGLAVEVRLERQAQDNCVACHMPRGPTDIPHFSFTHHRVGIHTEQPTREKLTELDQLVSIGDVSHLPEDERLRTLGLANDLFAGRLAGGLDDESRDDPSYRELAKVFEDRALRLLEEFGSRGARDPEVETFFSRMNWRKNPEQCIAHARAALASPQVSPGTRNAAMYNLASSFFDRKQYAQAFPILQELATSERSEISLMLLAICRQKAGDVSGAVRLIQAAIADSPDRADLHSYLASVYLKMGQPDEAERHRKLAELLGAKIPQPR